MDNANLSNPKESLNIISKAINQTRENLKEQSFYFILWGWLISIASLSHYLIIKLTDIAYSYIPWLILIPLGWIISIFYSMKKICVRFFMLDMYFGLSELHFSYSSNVIQYVCV